MSFVCVGAVLWDVFENARHIGGAPFNVAAHARRLGEEVYLVSGVGRDCLGEQALVRAGELDLDTRFINVTDEAPTGTVNVFLNEGQPDFTINRPAAYDFPRLTCEDIEAIVESCPKSIYFGTLEQMSKGTRRITAELLAALPHSERFYDVNLRKDSYTPALVEECLRQTTILKLNDDELPILASFFGLPADRPAAFAEAAANNYGIRTVCVTLGSEGCALWREGEYVTVPGIQVRLADAVGAGDAFSAVLMTRLWDQHASLSEVGRQANCLGAFVASKPGAVPDWTWDQVMALSNGN